MENRTYFVANDNGEIAGHDMDYAAATICLEEAEKDYPGEGWEILENDN